MALVKNITASFFCIAAAGCAVTADYQPPPSEAPEKWSTEQAHHAAVAQSAVAWWKTFGDSKLDSLIERAVQSNLDLRLARVRLQEVRKQLGITLASTGPSLSASASYAREKESANAPAPVLLARDGTVETSGHPDNLFQTGLDASWEIDLFGRQQRAIEESNAAVDVAAFERDGMIITLLAEVSRTYIELRLSQQQIALANEEIKLRTEFESLVSSRYSGGMVPYDELTRARFLARQVAAERTPLESRYQNALNRLGTLLGQWPSALASELATPTPIPVGPETIATGLPSDLLRQRPDVLRAERDIAVSSARLGVATADLYPRFSLNGSAGLASVSAADFFSAGSLLWKFGPTLTWPILRRGQIVATIEVRNLQQQQALLRYRKTILSSLEEADNAIGAHARQEKRRDAMAAAVDESEASLVMAQSRYAGGMADFREVLEAKIVRLHAQSDLDISKGDLALSAVALYKALGGGWNAASMSAQSDAC